MSIGEWRMGLSMGSPRVVSYSTLDIRHSTLAVAVALLLFQPNCIAPRRVIAPPVDPATLDDTAFLHYLATVPTVTVAEGVRAVGLLTGPSQQPASFEVQRGLLEGLGAVKPRWRLQPSETLDKGTLAYMLTVVCKTPKSLNEAVSAITGLGDRRYALKTCIDEGLMPYGLAHDAVMGGELITSLSKAENFLAVATTNGS